ncbi:YihY family inner membrane protein [Undibacterium sp.]|uniref:YihY family inner membrane protein n=1 Tax=Undibacterium sp. TaxID=1914977 RepID=UPI00374CA43E
MSLLEKFFMRGLSWSQISDLFVFAYKRLREGRLPQVAGSLTFTTVLALVPVLTIALAIFTAFPLFNTFRTSLEAYFIQSLMPQAIANNILGYLTQFATKATRLSAVGGVALMITAVTTLGMIDRAFNEIWHVKRARPWTQSILVYWAIITLGPLLIGVSITATSYLFTATSGVVGSVPFIGGVFYTLVSVFFTTGAFTLLYLAVPNRSIDWRDAAWGGLFAAIAFEIAKRFFAIFVTRFPTYTIVYGALAAVPIFLIWIYLSWLITLIGAVIAAALPVVKFERWWHVSAPGSSFVDALAVLKVLLFARDASDGAAVDVATIRLQTHFGLDEIDGLLEQMLEAGWVARVKDDLPVSAKSRLWKKIDLGSERWVLLANPDQLKLADVYRLFVFDMAADTGLAAKVGGAIEQCLQECLSSYFSGERAAEIARVQAAA